MTTAVADRRLAVLLGQAVGDALGAGTEFQSPAGIAAKYGAIDGYVQGAHTGFRPGEFTDDTHMALCILGAHWDVRLAGGDLAEATLRRFQEWVTVPPPDVGIATRGALDAARRAGQAGGLVQWERSRYESAGNGALMRAAASVVAGTRGEALYQEAVDLALLTHPDPRSLGAGVVFVAALDALLDDAAPADAWARALTVLDATPIIPAVAARVGKERAGPVEERLPEAKRAIRAAVEQGLTGAWTSQSGYVLHTLQAAVAASLAPSYLEGILPIVRRGDDSDTTAAVAGAALGARGLLPPSNLVDGLRCDLRWPSWPAGVTRGWPALAAFVPPRLGLESTSPHAADDEEDTAHRHLPTLPRFEFSEVAPGVVAGRAPLFRRNVWALRAAGVTHVLDVREEREWSGSGRAGPSAVAEIGRLGLPRLHLPVGDMGVPAPADFDHAVAFIETARHLGGTVYVHCRAGIERTAAILMAWYVHRHGCSVREALDALRERRPSLAPLPGQVNAVHAWRVTRRVVSGEW